MLGSARSVSSLCARLTGPTRWHRSWRVRQDRVSAYTSGCIRNVHTAGTPLLLTIRGAVRAIRAAAYPRATEGLRLAGPDVGQAAGSAASSARSALRVWRARHQDSSVGPSQTPDGRSVCG